MTTGPEAVSFDLGSNPQRAQEEGQGKRPDPFSPPIYDPLSGLYDATDPTLQTSQSLGEFARNTLALAGGLTAINALGSMAASIAVPAFSWGPGINGTLVLSIGTTAIPTTVIQGLQVAGAAGVISVYMSSEEQRWHQLYNEYQGLKADVKSQLWELRKQRLQGTEEAHQLRLALEKIVRTLKYIEGLFPFG
jgi:hypothetical protein